LKLFHHLKLFSKKQAHLIKRVLCGITHRNLIVQTSWYDQTGVKFPNLPSASSSSPDFSRFAMIQDMAWIDFFISGLKINYMVAGRIKFKNSSRNFIGDLVDWVGVKLTCIIFNSSSGQQFKRYP
jgi:hypothetical protein